VVTLVTTITNVCIFSKVTGFHWLLWLCKRARNIGCPDDRIFLLCGYVMNLVY
jgi:hypothetical protein